MSIVVGPFDMRAMRLSWSGRGEKTGRPLYAGPPEVWSADEFPVRRITDDVGGMQSLVEVLGSFILHDHVLHHDLDFETQAALEIKEP